MATVLVLSGVSDRDTLNTYAYRPGMVLKGVGEYTGNWQKPDSESLKKVRMLFLHARINFVSWINYQINDR